MIVLMLGLEKIFLRDNKKYIYENLNDCFKFENRGFERSYVSFLKMLEQ